MHNRFQLWLESPTAARARPPARCSSVLPGKPKDGVHCGHPRGSDDCFQRSQRIACDLGFR